MRRSPPSEDVLPLDLHVLSLPLAFILSQDQTLHCKYKKLNISRPRCTLWNQGFFILPCFFLNLFSQYLKERFSFYCYTARRKPGQIPFCQGASPCSPFFGSAKLTIFSKPPKLFSTFFQPGNSLSFSMPPAVPVSGCKCNHHSRSCNNFINYFLRKI